MLLVGNQGGYILLNLNHCTAFLQSIKLSEYKVKIIFFEKKLLAVNQNDYATKVLND